MVYRCRMDQSGALPGVAHDAYARDGVIVIEDFVQPARCDALKRRAETLVSTHAPNAPGTVFSTRDQRHDRDRYFEASGPGIGVFFEEEAFDADGALRVPLDKAVNKLGHAMHDLDDEFRAFSRGPRLQSVADTIGLTDAKILQSMYIFKQPGIGGEVVCHQDSTFLYTEPPTVAGFWFAIEDAHRGNGCLGGIPGAHLKGLRERYCRRADGTLGMDLLQPELAWDLRRIEWLEVSKGALIVFDGAFPHMSLPNRSAASRHAYTLHAISGGASYPGGNWLQRGPMDPPFTGFMPGSIRRNGLK